MRADLSVPANDTPRRVLHPTGHAQAISDMRTTHDKLHGVDARPPDDDDAIADSSGPTERRRAERREIDVHRAELVEALDRADARSWRRDVLFAAVGALIGGPVTAAVGTLFR